MQFAEMLLWMTNPQDGCSKWNVIISLTLIPLALMLQPLGGMFGSFFVIPWNESSIFRKWFTILFTIITVASISYLHLYKPEEVCTTITPKGHLFWTKDKINHHNESYYILMHGIWFIYIMLPFLIFWNKSIIFPLLLLLTPVFGFLYGHFKSDSRGSIWCFYTSFTSIIATLFLFLKNHGIYNVL
jgi:hypothetical protein